MKFGKRHKPTDSRNRAYPKQDKPKEIHPRHIIIKPRETKDKEKKIVKDKLLIDEHQFERQQICHWKPQRPEEKA